jgi:DNA repair exonuclease SbcCD ATPase subunit
MILANHEILADLQAVESALECGTAHPNGIDWTQEMVKPSAEFLDNAPHQELRNFLNEVRRQVVMNSDDLQHYLTQLALKTQTKEELEIEATKLAKQTPAPVSDTAIRKLRDQIAQENALAVDMKQRLQDVAKLEIEISQCDGSIEEFQRKIQRSNAYIKFFKEEEPTGEQRVKLEREMQQAQEVLLEQLQAEIKANQARNEALETQTRSLVTQLTEANSELESLNSKCPNILLQVCTAMKKTQEEHLSAQRLSIEMKFSDDQHNLLMKRRQRQEEKRKALQQLDSISVLRGEDAEASLKQADEEISMLVTENKLMSRKYVKMLASFEEQCDVRSRMRNEVHASSTLAHKLKDALHGLDKQTDSLRNETKRVAKKRARVVSCAQEEIEELTASIATLEEQLVKAQEDHDVVIASRVGGTSTSASPSHVDDSASMPDKSSVPDTETAVGEPMEVTDEKEVSTGATDAATAPAPEAEAVAQAPAVTTKSRAKPKSKGKQKGKAGGARKSSESAAPPVSKSKKRKRL